MRRKAVPILACVLLASAAPAQQMQLPHAPQISPSEGAAAVGLARQAMVDYLNHRAQANEVRIPDAAKPLLRKAHGAAVTLRRDGAELGQAIRQDGDLARNIIEAALWAMRSPRLPDVVTADYLGGLLVEVEVLGAPVKVQEANLAASITPGLTGVTAGRGLEEFTMLPSASCAGSLPAEEIVRQCHSGLPLKAHSASLPVRWAAFSTSHHVGYPDGKVLWLRQGRLPLSPEMIDANALSSAAEGVGLFLLRNQDKEGQFILPAGRQRTVDQLYATYALARLAKAGDRKDFAAGLNQALKWAVRRVEQKETFAFVGGVSDQEQLQAVSFLVLAMQEAPSGPQATELCRKLLATVDKALASQRAEGGDKPAGIKLPLKGLALSYLAASKAAPDDAERLESLRALIASTPAGDGEDICWLLRAGLPLAPDRPGGAGLAPLPAPPGGPLDPSGGFATAGSLPETVLTALSAVNIAEGKSWPGLKLPGAAAAAAAARREMVLSARRFCCQMQYRPLEPYFASRPELWIGGIRVAPGGSAITLRACAAAVEALLAE